ncbi:cytidine deaminase-like [Fopius arisanus]|uniref:Cytidine deaminase n=1 Tax=Fopius arisanus TaxID=64838 RepID=A0A9R1TWI1_9HYME|nr:PREDICTED: cytidine deaminase-like [Fopius arisanus]
MTAGKLIDFDDIEKDIQELIHESIRVRERAYCPYSNFQVGAALRCDDGTIVTGCNVENAAFTAGTCAERCAVSKAISEGKRKFRGLAVVANCVEGAITAPCGVCRQMLVEFGDMPVYLASPDKKKVLRTSLRELLPISFGFNGVIFE